MLELRSKWSLMNGSIVWVPTTGEKISVIPLYLHSVSKLNAWNECWRGMHCSTFSSWPFWNDLYALSTCNSAAHHIIITYTVPTRLPVCWKTLTRNLHKILQVVPLLRSTSIHFSTREKDSRHHAQIDILCCHNNSCPFWTDILQRQGD